MSVTLSTVKLNTVISVQLRGITFSFQISVLQLRKEIKMKKNNLLNEHNLANVPHETSSAFPFVQFSQHMKNSRYERRRINR